MTVTNQHIYIYVVCGYLDINKWRAKYCAKNGFMTYWYWYLSFGPGKGDLKQLPREFAYVSHVFNFSSQMIQTKIPAFLSIFFCSDIWYVDLIMWWRQIWPLTHPLRPIHSTQTIESFFLAHYCYSRFDLYTQPKANLHLLSATNSVMTYEALMHMNIFPP